MAMRINTNVSSLSTQRQLGIQDASLRKSLERLSSGMRINRAADDAAGLAISDGMNAQLRGYYQADANIQDAINLTQTGEGGLNETTSILTRMRELAVQAANDTYTQADRAKIQEEIGQLTQELDRIATTTQFNSRTLLDGSIAQSTAQQDATLDIRQNTRVGGPDPITSVPVFDDLIRSVTVTTSTTTTVDVALEIKVVAGPTAGIYNLAVSGSDGTSFTVPDVTGAGNPALNIFTAGGTTSAFLLNSGASIEINWGTVSVGAADIGDAVTLQLTGAQPAFLPDKALTFQIGANEGQIVKFGVSDNRAAALHLEGISVLGSTDQASRVQSQNMIGLVDEALRKVTVQRARMGAMQNRLEHAAANGQVALENLSASNSRIRDTDVASESANLTRNQILTQAGTAMLAQANTLPQNALSLLRG